MISSTVRLKVLIFAMVTALGVSYVLVHYIGLGRSLFGSQFTAYVDLADSGGIFPSASVTYRGIDVGRVTGLELRPQGIRASIRLNGKYNIPENARAVVANGSAIGEQYIDLRPASTSGPYLHANSVIPQSATSLPISSETLLTNLDQLVRSVPKDDLTTTISEAGKAFDNTGPALQRLLDSSTQLLNSARADAPNTISLIEGSGGVLDTQNSVGSDIVGFSQHLASLSDQLRKSDGDIRGVLDNGPPAAQQLGQLVNSIDTTLPILLGNLVSLGQVTELRQTDVRSVFIVYPYVVATGFTAFPGGHTTFTVPFPPTTTPGECTQGYPTSVRRDPAIRTVLPYQWNDYCQAPTSDQSVSPRGPRMATTPNGQKLGDTPQYKNPTRPEVPYSAG